MEYKPFPLDPLWRTAIAIAVTVTLIHLTFLYLPAWIAWIWTVIAACRTCFEGRKLYFGLDQWFVSSRKLSELNRKLALLSEEDRLRLEKRYERPFKDHVLSAYADMLLNG